MKTIQQALVTIGIILLAVQNVHAAGFTVNTQGAVPLGQGNAVIAHTDDPSSVFFNPALICKLPGTEIQAGTTLLIPGNKFESSFSGNSYSTASNVYFPSTFYATHKVSEKASVGVGFFSNFGLETNWDDDWEGRYIATKSRLTTFTVNPVAAFRLTPNVSLAAGVSFLYIDAELNKMINLSALGLPDVKQTLKGDDFSVGLNAGLLIDITRDISVGASYRSGISTDIRGNVSHVLPVPLPETVTSLFPNTGARAALKLPAMANFGVAYKGLSPLTIEVSGRWEGWSSYDKLSIQTDLPIAGYQEVTYPKEWKDTYSLNIGARYAISDAVAVMGGFINEGNPIPDETFDPVVPSNRSQVYCIGTDIRFKNVLLGISYAFQKVKDRTKNNTIDGNPFDGVTDPATSANGSYRTHLHMIGVSIGYQF